MRKIARTPQTKRIDHISRLIATGHSVQDIAEILTMLPTAVYPLLRRHAYYLIASLPTAKYVTLRQLIDKGRPVDDISVLLSIPVTLVTAAKRLKESDDYPSPKQRGS